MTVTQKRQQSNASAFFGRVGRPSAFSRFERVQGDFWAVEKALLQCGFHGLPVSFFTAEADRRKSHLLRGSTADDSGLPDSAVKTRSLKAGCFGGC